MIEASALAPEETTFPMWGALGERALIAMHHCMYEEAGHSLERYGQWTERAITQVNEPNWSTTQQANDILMVALLAAHEGKLDKARAKAEKYKAMLADLPNPRRYEGWHQLMGLIALKDGDADRAIDHLQQSDLQNPIAKLELAMAQEAAGNREQARRLYDEVVNFRFNSVMTALARNRAAERLLQFGP